MSDPSDELRSMHESRKVDKSAVGLWYSGLSLSQKRRFRDYVEAFEAHPEYRLPTLVQALRNDEILGDAGAQFPTITPESVGRFLLNWVVEPVDE
jgi:hypothetical protein